jgi:hypothetical protein
MRGEDVTEPRREIVENEARDVEAEDAVDEGPRRTPWDAHKIRVSTKPWSLRQAIDDLKDGTIDLAPDFQRPSVWTKEKRSRLIESILLGIPLPAFYFSADSDGAMQVVDGVQRLSAIRDFAANELALGGLEYLATLEGKPFNDLEAPLRRRFNQTQIFVNVIEPETPVEVKFNIFKRVNTGGEPLTPQEIRHALSQGRSRAVLKRMASSEAFHSATGGAFQSDPRLTARELALRFIALRLDPDLRAYETAETVDDYLVACTRRLDDETALSDGQIEEIEQLFERSMRAAREIFGEHAFRKWPVGSERRSPLNRALFESWSAVLADYELDTLMPRKDAIVEATREAFATNTDYLSAITAATGDLARVRVRLEVARQIVKGTST